MQLPDSLRLIDGRLIFPDSVCVLHVNGAGEMLLVRQDRAAHDRYTLELPGGKVEEGESRVEAALRELDALKASMMADGTDEQFRAFLNILQPDESLAVMTADARGHADTWGTIARTYIRLTDDQSLPVAMQDRLIAEADALTPDNPYDVHTLATSHVGFLLKPAKVAGPGHVSRLSCLWRTVAGWPGGALPYEHHPTVKSDASRGVASCQQKASLRGSLRTLISAVGEGPVGSPYFLRSLGRAART
ncbi:NUDIX hydrolase [Streptomyces sp. NPDC004227]